MMAGMHGSGVEVLSVSCNHCGAPLSLPAGARFVTCTHCGSRLAVHASGGAAYTEVLGEIRADTRRIAGDVEAIKVQNQLEQMDREWMIERERYMIHGKHGSHLPTEDRAAGTVMGVFVIAFGVIWTIIAGVAFPPMALFGVFFIGFAIYGLMSGNRKAQEYRAAEERYQSRRRAVLEALGRTGGGDQEARG